MKTPKRTPWQHTTQPCLKADGELRACINEQHARWKRKNRIARLKDKIARLTAENKWLSEERLQYINFYYNALSDLVKTREMLDTKKQYRSSAEHRKEQK